MTERVEFDVDETTAAYLCRCAHQRGVSIGAAAAVVNEGDGATVLGVHLVDRDPQLLLAPQIGAHGFANVMTIEAVLRRRLDARIGLATPQEMEQVSNALRAAQDL